MEKALKALGLTDGEIKVYFALIELGETTTGPVVDKSGVSVSKVYIILDKLAEKGLVSHILKKKTKYFRAVTPKRLLDYVNEKQKQLTTLKKDIEELVPQLEAKQNSALTEETAQIFDGLRGIQTARERTLQILQKGDEMWIVGVSQYAYDKLQGYFFDYHQRRHKKGIICKFIFNEAVRETYGKIAGKYPLSEVRYLPPGITTYSWMEIYADTLTVGLNYQKSFSVVIENQVVADSFREYVRLLWSIAKP